MGSMFFRNIYIFFLCLFNSFNIYIYIYIAVSGYYENIFICIFYFKIVLNNLSLGNAGCRSFGMIQNLVEKKKKKIQTTKQPDVLNW
jgi:hypothetical protein